MDRQPSETEHAEADRAIVLQTYKASQALWIRAVARQWGRPAARPVVETLRQDAGRLDESTLATIERASAASEARWVEAVAQQWGWAAANRFYHDTLERIGRMEMAQLTKSRGLAAPVSEPDRTELLRAAIELFQVGVAAGGDATLEPVDAGNAEICVRRCPLMEHCEATNWQGLTACGCFSRRRGWYAALGIQVGEDLIEHLKWGDGRCRIRLSSKPVTPDNGDGQGTSLRSKTPPAPRIPLAGRILLPDNRPIQSLAAYEQAHGLEALRRAHTLSAEEIIRQISQAGLRGRGGAGFPTGVKWAGARADPGQSKYLVCNGAEGEPGAFKDRYLIRMNPYQVLEGLLIAADAIGARRAFVCLKQRFAPEAARLRDALDELVAAGVPGAEGIELIYGPDSYLFGEEKALLEVIEGGLPLPRRFPPYIHGLFGSVAGGPNERLHNPTVVDNVETLANVPHIIRHGPQWFRSIGTAGSPGTMVFTLSGDVRLPGVYERPLGTILRTLIEEDGGGSLPGRRIQAVFPGVSNAPLTGHELDVPLDFDAMRDAGSALGSGGFIVYDDTACLVQVAYSVSNFLYVESCNQCPSCKLGSGRITEGLRRLLDGTGTQRDLKEILNTTSWVENGARCALPTAESLAIAGVAGKFWDQFAGHLGHTCKRRHDLPLPKLTDYDGEGRFTYDEHYAHKRPDWTYDDEARVPALDEGALQPLGPSR